MEGVSDTDTDDDATTQDNRADVSVAASAQLLAVFVTSRRAEGQLRMQSLGHNQLPHRLSRSRQFAQFVWRSSVTVPYFHVDTVLHMSSGTNCDCYRQYRAPKCQSAYRGLQN